MPTSTVDINAQLGVREAARALGISESWVRLLTDLGRLTCTRDRWGRRLFTDADLHAYREARRRRRRKSNHTRTVQPATT